MEYPDEHRLPDTETRRNGNGDESNRPGGGVGGDHEQWLIDVFDAGQQHPVCNADRGERDDARNPRPDDRTLARYELVGRNTDDLLFLVETAGR